MTTKSSNDAVSRTQLLEQFFNGIEDSEEELANTLKAMGLKPNGTKFKQQTAYCIGIVRSWVDSGEITDYDALSQVWEERKESVNAAYEQESSALTSVQQGDMVAGNDVGSHTGTDAGSHTGNNPAHNLSIPAQRSYDAGLQIAQGMEGRIQHNQELAAKVVDGAFYRGLNDGLGKLGNDYQPEPLVTDQQVDDILDQVVENARHSREPNG
ncbi:hypothetical protein [Acaryochloris marina]|uniref:Uncharacterized protein n=1 Tax=Acaryochloris marina (strain MBIC 11017) TaxID=329726 RepID=A8ZPA1_ACAM1|nr:hypothetical protein [Acaryochloris marina]ABW32837.1 hypothetical protein AM1_E0067 [Acaryochloris marina MBIC11017]